MKNDYHRARLSAGPSGRIKLNDFVHQFQAGAARVGSRAWLGRPGACSRLHPGAVCQRGDETRRAAPRHRQGRTIGPSGARREQRAWSVAPAAPRQGAPATCLGLATCKISRRASFIIQFGSRKLQQTTSLVAKKACAAVILAPGTKGAAPARLGQGKRAAKVGAALGGRLRKAPLPRRQIGVGVRRLVLAAAAAENPLD